MSKVLAINGSPHTNGNTASMLREILSACEKGGAETEFFQVGGLHTLGCVSGRKCAVDLGKCALDDWMNELYIKIKSADAIVIGSPTFFSDLTPETKSVLDRIGMVSRNDGNSLSRKIGAGISAVRRAGGIHTIDSINHFFLINDMIIPGSSYWAMSLARVPGDYQNDEEGVATMKRLGENIMWLLNKLNGSAVI